MRIRTQKFSAAERLAYNSVDNLWIVEDTDEKIYVMCGRCEHKIYYESGYGGKEIVWKCSNELHAKEYIRAVPTYKEGTNVERSTVSVRDGTTYLERWAAYWFNVPAEDVQITRT